MVAPTATPATHRERGDDDGGHALVGDRQAEGGDAHRGGRGQADLRDHAIVALETTERGDREQEQRGRGEHRPAGSAGGPESRERRPLERLAQSGAGQGQPARSGTDQGDPRQHGQLVDPADGSQGGEGDDGKRADQQPVTEQVHRGGVRREEADARDHLRRGQATLGDRPGEGNAQQGEADDQGQLGRRALAEPAGAIGADQVERQQAEGDRAQRLAGHAEASRGQPAAEAGGGDREPGQHSGAAADAEPRPGHREEDDRGDEQAQGAQAEQDGGHRRGSQAGPSGSGTRRGIGGIGGTKEVAGTGTGATTSPQLADQVVGPGERRGQAGRERVVQREPAGGAGRGRAWQGCGAVGAHGGVGVPRHVPIDSTGGGGAPPVRRSAG